MNSTYTFTDFTNHILNTLALVRRIDPDRVPHDNPEAQMKIAVAAILNLATDAALLRKELNFQSAGALDKDNRARGHAGANDTGPFADSCPDDTLIDKINGFYRAKLFWNELHASGKSLPNIAQEYGAGVVAALMSIQHALLVGTRVDPDTCIGQAGNIVRELPSGDKWSQLIKPAGAATGMEQRQ